MPRFKAIFFIKIALKLSYFCEKSKLFERWGLRLQTPVPSATGGLASIRPASGSWNFAPRPLLASGGWGLRLQTKTHTALPIANFWLRACWSLLFSNFLNFLAPTFRKSCVCYCTESPVLCILDFSCLTVRSTLQENTSRFYVVFYFWEILIIFMPRRFYFNLLLNKFWFRSFRWKII